MVKKQIRFDLQWHHWRYQCVVTNCYQHHQQQHPIACFALLPTPVCLSVDASAISGQAATGFICHPILSVPHARTSSPHGKPVILQVHWPPPRKPSVIPLSHLIHFCGMFGGPWRPTGPTVPHPLSTGSRNAPDCCSRCSAHTSWLETVPDEHSTYARYCAASCVAEGS